MSVVMETGIRNAKAAAQLEKMGIDVTVARDAKEWPVSVLFVKQFNEHSRMGLLVRRENTDLDLGTFTRVINGESIIKNVSVIESTLDFAWTGATSAAGYTITLLPASHDTVKGIIAYIDKDPKAQFATALNLLKEGISGLSKAVPKTNIKNHYSYEYNLPEVKTDVVKITEMCSALLRELE